MKLQSKSPCQDHLDHRFDSQDADWEAYGMPNYSKLTGQAPSHKVDIGTCNCWDKSSIEPTFEGCFVWDDSMSW